MFESGTTFEPGGVAPMWKLALHPGMFQYLLQRAPLLRITDQNLGNEVFQLMGDLSFVREFKLAVLHFLVDLLHIFGIKGCPAVNEGVDDDAD